MHDTRLFATLTVLGTVLLACSKGDQTADTTGAAGASVAAMASQSPPVGGSTSAAGALTDPNIV